MRTQQEFDSYYERDLKPIVASLEEKRIGLSKKYSFKRYGRNLLWMAVSCIAIMVAFANVPGVPPVVTACIPLTGLYALAYPIYILIKRDRAFKPINEEYKSKVISKIVTFAGSDLQYKKDEGITEKEFDLSRLFVSPYVFLSEDLVEGRADTQTFRLSNVNAYSRMPGKGTTIQQLKKNKFYKGDLLSGVFAIFNLSKTISTPVIIKPIPVQNKADKFMSGIIETALAGAIDTNSAATDSIKTGNQEFDKTYTVQCFEEGLSKRILSPESVQLIMAFGKELNTELYVSLIDNHLYLAYRSLDLFDWQSHVKFTETNISKQYFNYLNQTLGFAFVMETCFAKA